VLGGIGISYHAENRLISVSGGSAESYVYDAFGRRIGRTGNGYSTDYYYDLAGNAITMIDPNGGWSWGEVFLGNLHLATYGNNKTYFSYTNLIGSTRINTDEQGNVAQNCVYLPFGEQDHCTSPGQITALEFAGMERDRETGLDHTWFRYYNSRLGRWMSVDPVDGNPLNPQSWNHFAYVLNNPANSIDPDGRREHPMSAIPTDSGGCTLMGVYLPCSIVQSAVKGGAAVQCPDNYCGAIHADGQWRFFGAWADGSSGYVPGGLAGFSVKDLESLRLEPYSDCSRIGGRKIQYEVTGPKSAKPEGWWVTEHQDPPAWAGNPSGATTGADPGYFIDTIFNWKTGPSQQTFTISREDPTKNPNVPSVGIIVRLGGQDYGTLAIQHGGTRDYTYIQGNKSGWAQCD